MILKEDVLLGKKLLINFAKELWGWKSILLSQASRLALCRSILNSIPTYYMSAYKLLSKDINYIERIIRNFWWGHEEQQRKIHTLSWNKITLPIS